MLNNTIPTLSRNLKALVASVALLGGASQASAALVFDSFSGGTSASNRAAESSPGLRIVVTTATTVTSIAVLNNMSGAANLKFLIFDNSNVLLFSTGSKAFADDGADPTWKESDAFSFTLQAGLTYQIGAISDTSGLWSFDVVSDSMNGMTSLTSNPNFSIFASPAIFGSGGADAAVRLFDGGAVPEPSVALLGLAALGLTARRRRA
jgi:hypothetical protein